MKKYQYQQLDADAKAYLRFVRDGKGRGAPGIFLSSPSRRPTWAFLMGLVILPLFLWIGYTSSKAGWATAMLQTAGVLLGGWLIVFAVRRWMANPDTFAGNFVYFDPEHVYYGMGEDIQIARVGRDPQVEPRGENMVRFDTERGVFTVPARGRILAQYVTDYYEALKWVQSRTDGTWVGLNSAEAGAVARFLVEEDREPNTIADTGLEAEEIPNQVTAATPASFGMVRYLIVLGAAAGIFALFAMSNPSIQDDMAFNDAKDTVAAEQKKNTDGSVKPNGKGFTGAYAVRDYLLNEKHTRHRAAAEKLLSDLYTAPIARVANGPGDPALKAEVVTLLNDLRTPMTPAISIRVTLNGAEIPGDRGKQVRSLLADGFATAVGKDLVVCGAAPDGVKANLEVAYKTADGFRWYWTVEVRTKVDQKTPATATGTLQGVRSLGQSAFGSQQTINFDGGSEQVDEPLKAVLGEDDAVYQAVMTRMFGYAPPRPMAE